MQTSTADKIVWAACSLHNWLGQTSASYMTRQAVDTEDLNTGEVIPGLWRSEVEELTSVRNLGSNNYKKAAEEVRSLYKAYFWNEGSVPWQWKAVGLNEEDTAEDDA